ncbi:MAG: sigma 54-interacting transcriptional regulator [Planctomycetes bacterium]|nr:sigma 54-interacting transcriptional regulator [Planctomycetota bacterium]MCB9903085.1 sigma 54-interacting transcriptional regulator [Planctomycetota bacterium]
MSRILVIDDDPGNRLIVKSRLGDLGYEVLLAETGAEGLVEARQESLDMVMVTAPLGSGIDAVEVCRRLKSMPQTGVVPVLLYNNNPASGDEMGRAYDAGCDAYVAKSSMPVLDHVVRVLLRQKSIHADLKDQNAVLERQNRALVEQAQCKEDRETSQRDAGEQSLAIRHLAAGRPDGMMLVDAEGFVRRADRGACEFFGNRIEGKNLGSLAPASGLEAFVRDARSESREGFRFDLSAIGGRTARSLTASVVPLVTTPGESARGLKVVLLLDVGRRRIAAEMLRTSEPGIPRQQLGSLLDAAHEVYNRAALVGESSTMHAARDLVQAFAKHPRPVLIEGPKGVGKLRLARTLHYSGPFSGAFLQVRCSAFDEAGLAKELFGYVREGGDASSSRPGLLHQACDGTLYLEELGGMPKAVQDRLLEFMRTGQVVREGGTRKEQLEVHLIASTSVDLAGRVKEGKFSKDLFALFAECRIALPPLVERAEDVLPLAIHYVSRYGPANGVHEITDEALHLFLQYDWPANVAELIEVVREACRLATDGTITPATMPQRLRELAEDLPTREVIPASPRESSPNGTHRIGAPNEVRSSGPAVRRHHEWDITDDDPISLDHYEMKVLLRALEHVDGDKLAAARLLNVGKSTLYRKLKRFGIQ